MVSSSTALGGGRELRPACDEQQRWPSEGAQAATLCGLMAADSDEVKILW